MRLNDGAPVWHVSLSIWSPSGFRMSSPGQIERLGIDLLTGVGNEREWWYWNPKSRIGHLRVGLTDDEVDKLKLYPAEHDAGESGTERKRKVRR